MHTDLPWPGLPLAFGSCALWAWVSPIGRTNLEITPQASGGHAQPRLDHPPRSAGGLSSALSPVSSPRRIELNRMFQVMYGTPPTLLSFTLAGILSKRLEDYAFALAFPCGSACEQGLLPGLQRSLIVIATPALVLSHGDTARRALSPQVVLQGSMNSTSRPAILPPSHVLLFAWGCCACPSLVDSSL